MSNKNSQPSAMFCLECGGTRATAANPLLPLATEGADGVEYIHRLCAKTSNQFGFCWCCGEHVVYPISELNEASECGAHAGEAVPDYPEEDAESYIENVRNNDGM